MIKGPPIDVTFRTSALPPSASGLTFGFSIERLALRKYKITDIRTFSENDLRFVRQF